MTETMQQMFRVRIAAPLQAVWDQLTRQGEPLPHFFGSVMHTTGLRPGAALRMRTPDGKYTGVVGEILECDPPHRFAHTFRFTNLDDPWCKVIYELREVDDQVELTLSIVDVPAGTKTEKYMVQGGTIITNTLKAVAETGKPPFSTRMILLVNKLMAPFTPRKCRSEFWPLDESLSSGDAS